MASTSTADEFRSSDPELMPAFLKAFFAVTREPWHVSGRRMTDREKFDWWCRVNEELESDPDSVKERLYEWLCRVTHDEAEALRLQMQSVVDEEKRMATESLRDLVQVQAMPADSPWFDGRTPAADDPDAASVILAQYEAARAAVRAAMQLLLEKCNACTLTNEKGWPEVQAYLDAAVDAAVVAAGGQFREQVTQETRTFVEAYVNWLRRIGHDLYIAPTVEDHEGRIYHTSSHRRWLRWPRALRVRAGPDPWARGCHKFPAWSVPHEDLRQMDAEVQQAMLRATAGLLLRDLPANVAANPERMVEVIAFLAPHSPPDAAIDAWVCNNAACSLETKCLLVFGFDAKNITSAADRIQQHVCAAPVEPKDAVDMLCVLDTYYRAADLDKDLLSESIVRLLQHLLSHASKRAWFETYRPRAARIAYCFRRQGLLDAGAAYRVFPKLRGSSSAWPEFVKRQRLD